MKSRPIIVMGVSAMMFVAVIATARHASADGLAADANPNMCSVDEGKRLRAAGKFKEAGTFYLTCREQCAPSLHPECERAAQDVLAAMPTVVVHAKDARGNPLTDVAVTIDGNVAATELDGKALAVDPGPHTIVLKRQGAAITQQIVATEGTKAQPVWGMFKNIKDPDGMARDIGGHTVWPWAVVAVGAAGVVSGIAIVATAPSLPEGCNSDSKVCEPLPGERSTSSSFTQRREQAGQSVDQPKVGGVMIGLGVALAAGGLIWHFIEPTEPRTGKRERPIVTPWAAHQSGGLAAVGTF